MPDRPAAPPSGRSAAALRHALIALGLIAAAPAVDVTLTGAALDHEGATTVPLGLFGVHAVGLTERLVDDLGITCNRDIHFLPSSATLRLDGRNPEQAKLRRGLAVFIDCHGDRFHPPLVLTRPKDWKQVCEQLGAGYAAQWQRPELAGITGYVEWWNEAYLNWGERSAGSRGSTINQEFYDLAKAVDGGPVTIKGWTEPLTYFRWRELWPVRYVDGKDKKGNPVRKRIIGWSVPMPAGAAVGTAFKGAETRYWREPGVIYDWVVEKHFYPVDPTAISFFSAKQNLDFYRWTFGAWARALRAGAPQVRILAGWDFNFEAGDWWMWKEMYRPLLREFPDLIDGVTEHHYGIPLENIQAWYECADADSRALRGRPLRTFNTECQGRLDPAVHGGATNAAGEETAEGRRWEARYNLGDMIGLAARMPDKVGSRTVHNFVAAGFPDSGAAWALRLVKPLRGTLLAVRSGDPRLWAAASRSDDGSLCLALYNHGERDADCRIDLGPFASGGAVARRVVADAAGGDALRIEEAPMTGNVTVPSRDAVVIVATGSARPAGALVRRQHYAREGALPDAADGSVRFTCALPPGAAPAAAVFRLSLSGGSHRAAVRWNGRELAADQGQPVQDLPLAGAAAGEHVFSVTPEPGVRVIAGSIIADAPRP